MSMYDHVLFYTIELLFELCIIFKKVNFWKSHHLFLSWHNDILITNRNLAKWRSLAVDGVLCHYLIIPDLNYPTGMRTFSNSHWLANYTCYNRTYELKVHGGTPFESGIELDAAQGIKGQYVNQII